MSFLFGILSNLKINQELLLPQKIYGHLVRILICFILTRKYKICKYFKDIVLFNSADVAYSTQRDNYLIEIHSDGNVIWIFPDILKSYCQVDIRYFPFDK